MLKRKAHAQAPQPLPRRSPPITEAVEQVLKRPTAPLPSSGPSLSQAGRDRQFRKTDLSIKQNKSHTNHNTQDTQNVLQRLSDLATALISGQPKGADRAPGLDQPHCWNFLES